MQQVSINPTADPGLLLLLPLQDTQRVFSFELDEIDMLDIDAAYEGANQPTTDVYAWERGGNW